jgi:hypothetical protein
MKFQLASIVTFFSLLTVNAHLTHKLGWSLLDTRLPKPLSDHSASLSKDNGLVYIAGGCGRFIYDEKIQLYLLPWFASLIV